ncbi:hypothetical protein BO221_36985 [Archangium sp. Cb G35]|nr:hypothetical protein BO221_36985 [Archangium sp. Cb G35]
MAASLGLLILSCSVARSPAIPGPTGAKDLSRYVLVIEETTDGQVNHAWKPISDFDLSGYSPYRADNGLSGGHIVHAAWTRDCDEERDQCVKMCAGSLRGKNWTHATKDSKDEICRTRCYPAYRDCCDLRDRATGGAVEFTALNSAVDWLKQNREKILVGAVVVIAGVAFVAVATGGGGLILAPALLFASHDAPSNPHFAVSQP